MKKREFKVTMSRSGVVRVDPGSVLRSEKYAEAIRQAREAIETQNKHNREDER